MATDPRFNAKNAYIAKLLQEGMSTAPVQHWTQGAARVAQALLGGAMMNDEDRKDREASALLMNAPGLGTTQAPPTQPTGGNPNYANAIASIESGGKYDAMGPVTRTGDRAHGKYQIMGANIGPWSQAALGRQVTPQEFLANPQLQDQIFQHQFGQYVQKYGPEGAARAWFAGEGGMNDPNRRDQLGTTVGQYGQRFAQAAGVPGQPMPQQKPQGASVMPQDMTGQTGAMPQTVQQSPQIPPATAAYIRQLLANPRTQAQGQALYAQYAKRPELKSVVAGERAYVFNPATGQYTPGPNAEKTPEALRIVEEMRRNPQAYGFSGPNDPNLIDASRGRLSGQTSAVNVSTVANPVLEGVGKQIVEGRQRAQGAVNTIPILHDARRALDAGAITGVGADWRVAAQKIGALFGMSAEEASNSEVFRGVIGREVLNSIKALGANPSNTDRDYIEKVSGGQIALEANSLRRLLDIHEKYARQAIKSFNDDAAKLMQADPNQYRGIAPLMRFDEPPAYAGQPVPTRGVPPELKQKYGLE